MTLRGILQNAFVVSDQKERLEQFMATFRAVGLDPLLVRVWRACRIPGEGTMGCAIAQYSLIRHAQAVGLPFLVVFEDDAVPADDAPQGLVGAFEGRPQGCLALSLGWTWDSDREMGLCRNDKRRVYGSHAYALFGQEGYAAWLRAWESNGTTDMVLDRMDGSYMTPRKYFKQHTVGASIHLPQGWGAPRELEMIVDGEQRDRYALAAEELRRRRAARL